MKKAKVGLTLLLVFAFMACAAHTPLKKAKVAQDIFIGALETTAQAMPRIEKQFPAKVKEIKKVYMQAKKAVQAYQYALKVWEKIGQKPKDYEDILTNLLKSIGELRKLGTSMGVKYD